MLLNKETRQRRHGREPQRRNPHASERFNISLHNPIVPPLRQAVNLLHRISDAANLLFRSGETAKPPLEPGFKQILENGGGDGDSDRRACRAESVRRRGYHGLVFVLDGRDEGDESYGQHTPVRGAAHEQVSKRRRDIHVRGESR